MLITLCSSRWIPLSRNSNEHFERKYMCSPYLWRQKWGVVVQITPDIILGRCGFTWKLKAIWTLLLKHIPGTSLELLSKTATSIRALKGRNCGCILSPGGAGCDLIIQLFCKWTFLSHLLGARDCISLEFFLSKKGQNSLGGRGSGESRH